MLCSREGIIVAMDKEFAQLKTLLTESQVERKNYKDFVIGKNIEWHRCHKYMYGVDTGQSIVDERKGRLWRALLCRGRCRENWRRDECRIAGEANGN